jgi:uncharacterized protein YfiM (DUF2279 family)
MTTQKEDSSARGLRSRLRIALAVITLVVSSYTLRAGIPDQARPVMHFGISGGLAFGGCAVATTARPSGKRVAQYTIAASLATIPGVAKEWYDSAHGKPFSLSDIGFDLLGVATGLTLHYVVRDRPRRRSRVTLGSDGSGLALLVRL